MCSYTCMACVHILNLISLNLVASFCFARLSYPTFFCPVAVLFLISSLHSFSGSPFASRGVGETTRGKEPFLKEQWSSDGNTIQARISNRLEFSLASQPSQTSQPSQPGDSFIHSFICFICPAWEPKTVYIVFLS